MFGIAAISCMGQKETVLAPYVETAAASTTTHMIGATLELPQFVTPGSPLTIQNLATHTAIAMARRSGIHVAGRTATHEATVTHGATTTHAVTPIRRATALTSRVFRLTPHVARQCHELHHNNSHR